MKTRLPKAIQWGTQRLKLVGDGVFFGNDEGRWESPDAAQVVFEFSNIDSVAGFIAEFTTEPDRDGAATTVEAFGETTRSATSRCNAKRRALAAALLRGL